MKYKKLLSTVSVVLCVVLLTNITALAVNTQPEAAVESISIFPMYGVIEGEVRQMQATVDAGDSFLSSVEWSSSNPNVISCTEDGKIKGLVAGESATITCKAKWSSAKDTIKVYCVKKISPDVKCKLKGPFVYILAQPAQGKWSRMMFVIPDFLDMILYIVRLVASAPVSSMALPFPTFDSSVTVYGRIKEYAYVRFGESESYDGFINYKLLPKSINGFLELSSEDMPVWANGITYANRKLTTAYDGKVEWDVDNEKYINFDESTGQITGLSEGVGKTTTVTAKADGMTAYCTIHLLYKWEQAWTTKTNKDTSLYAAKGKGYNAVRTLPVGTKFVVQGDCGTDSGWAYGYFSIGEKDYWGFVPIEDISTKGTISQYNNMETTIYDGLVKKEIPWIWPVKNEIDGVAQSKNANYISSPYAPRSDTTSTAIHHRGIDITTGTEDEIKEYTVVSATSGTVKAVRQNVDSCGYCISISSDCIDPVTGQKIAVIYMHLYEASANKEGVLFQRGDEVYAGMVIGKVGKTNANTNEKMGYHLHFETNNRNAAVGEDGRSDFTNTINSLYFYMNKDIRINKGSEACVNGYGAYWYNKNK